MANTKKNAENTKNKENEEKKEQKCWYLIANIKDEDYDKEIDAFLYPEGCDPELSPPCALLNELISKLSKKYDKGKKSEKRPILKQPNLLKWSYCPDYRTYLISVDEEDRHLLMWKKGVVH